MGNELQTLAEIFNNRLFRIPDYQRGYAWTEHQRDDFWSDLERAANAQRNHYCGQLTLELAPEKEWNSWVEDAGFIRTTRIKANFVVDGQQRLTTAIILLHALLEGLPDEQLFAGIRVSSHREKYLVMPVGQLRHCLFGYANDNPSHLYFRTRILCAPSNDYSGVITLYTANLGSALEYFRAKIASSDMQQRETWFAALTQRFLFNLYELSNDIDVFVAFETMNNRGKPLTRLELLKNRLIYLSTLAQSASEDERNQTRRNINAVWRTVYEQLGRNPKSPLDDDDFLRAHLIVYFADINDPDPLTEFLLNKHFTPARLDAGSLTLANIQEYIDSLQLSVRCWHQVHFPEAHTDTLTAEVVEGLERMRRLGYGVFRPLFLANLAKAKNTSDQVRVLEEAERFQLLARSFAGARSNVAENDSQKWARELFWEERDAASVADALNDRVKRHFSVDLFQLRINGHFENGLGYYSLNGLHYMLYAFEEDIQREIKATKSKIDWKKFKGSWDTIEHVYPQEATDTDWPAFASYDSNQQHHLCHSLGNLVALTHSKNSSLKRLPFFDKVNGTDTCVGFKLGSYSENVIADNSEWTAEQIKTRGMIMLRFIERRWKITLGDDETKLKLLKAEIWAPPITQS